MGLLLEVIDNDVMYKNKFELEPKSIEANDKCLELLELCPQTLAVY